MQGGVSSDDADDAGGVSSDDAGGVYHWYILKISSKYAKSWESIVCIVYV